MSSDRDSIAIELQQVSYQIRQHKVLSDCNLAIPAVSQTAIVGRMGTGKSTILRLLNRLIEPTEGKIYYRGQNLTQIKVSDLRRQIMLLPQQTSLLGMNGKDAIVYPLRLRGFSQTAIAQQLEKWTELLHIEAKLLRSSEVQLSAGQKQWLAIARALVTEPAVLMLDEPTTHLDLGRVELLLDILNQLSSNPGDRFSNSNNRQNSRSEQYQASGNDTSNMHISRQQLRAPIPTTVIMVTQQLDLLANWGDFVIQVEPDRSPTLQRHDQVNWQDLQNSLRLNKHDQFQTAQLGDQAIATSGQIDFSNSKHNQISPTTELDEDWDG